MIFVCGYHHPAGSYASCDPKGSSIMLLVSLSFDTISTAVGTCLAQLITQLKMRGPSNLMPPMRSEKRTLLLYVEHCFAALSSSNLFRRSEASFVTGHEVPRRSINRQILLQHLARICCAAATMQLRSSNHSYKAGVCSSSDAPGGDDVFTFHQTPPGSWFLFPVSCCTKVRVRHDESVPSSVFCTRKLMQKMYLHVHPMRCVRGGSYSRLNFSLLCKHIVRARSYRLFGLFFFIFNRQKGNGRRKDTHLFSTVRASVAQFHNHPIHVVL